MTQNNSNVLLNNRTAFNSRHSMDALINFARYHPPYQDNKMKKYILDTKSGVMAKPSRFILFAPSLQLICFT